MDRQEFTEILSNYRKHSGMPIKDICFKLKWMSSDFYKFENAKHNYNLQKCFDYLNAVNVCMIVTTIDSQSVKFRDYPTLLNFIVNRRTALGYTQRKLSAVVKVSHTAIGHAELQKTVMTIDTFLKIADVLNFTIDIIPVPPSNEQ